VAHLVWDWNGTLLDDLDLVVDATNAALAGVGGPQITAEAHRRDFRRPVQDYYAYVLGRPVDRAEFAELDAAFHDYYRQAVPGCPLTAGALSAIEAWTGTQSLLSMFFHHELVPLVDAYRLTDRLSRVDGLADALGGGPKAPHLAAHLVALGLTGRDCVLIGDSVDDAEAAAEVGARVVLYGNGFTDPALLQATGQPVAWSLVEAVELATRHTAAAGAGR
jgi:phosphoglycolate phosphatase-like HAD superfamily hydrolase